MKRFVWLILSCVACFSLQSFAYDTLTISSHNKNQTFFLNDHWSYFIDSNGDSSINGILHLHNNDWSKMQGKPLRFGITKNAVWLATTFHSKLSNEEKFIVEFDDPSLYKIIGYHHGDEQTMAHKAGTGFSQADRSYPGNKNNLLITLPPGHTTLFVRVASTNSMTITGRLLPYQAAMASYSNERVLLGLFYGGFLLLIIMSFVLYTIMRRTVFIIYMAYIFFVAIFTGAADGFLSEYLWILVDLTHGYQDIISAIMCNIWGLAFMISFLKIEAWDKNLNTVVQYFIAGSVTSVIICGFINIGSTFVWLQVLGLLTLSLTIYTGIQAVRKRVPQATYFLIAYIIFDLCIFAFILNLFRIVEYSFFIKYSIHFGYAGSLPILAIALGVRIKENTLKKEREKQEIIKQKNHELEIKVNERTKDLKVKELNLRTILENNDSSIWLIDAEFRILDYNILFKKVWNNYFGNKLKKGDKIIDIIPDNNMRQLWLNRYLVALQGKSKTYIEKLDIDNNTYWHEIKCFPIKDDGRVTGLSLFSKDITETLMAERQLKDQNEKLVKANRELDSFVYSASHDLKAPLASILGLIHLVKNESNLKTRLSYYEMMERSVGRLDQFIKDIIDYSRNERTEVTITQVDFNKIIKEAFEDLNYLENAGSIKKNIEINTIGDFFNDTPRIHVIFRNLLSNAIKYGCSEDFNQRKIDVSVKADQLEAVIQIRDYGRGIEPGHLEYIFNMFYRAHDNSTGTGLGLYIVKETIMKIGGEIQVESNSNKGTAFTFVIPNKKCMGQTY